jgi:hypothetical protein
MIMTRASLLGAGDEKAPGSLPQGLSFRDDGAGKNRVVNPRRTFILARRRRRSKEKAPAAKPGQFWPSRGFGERPYPRGAILARRRRRSNSLASGRDLRQRAGKRAVKDARPFRRRLSPEAADAANAGKLVVLAVGFILRDVLDQRHNAGHRRQRGRGEKMLLVEHEIVGARGILFVMQLVALR